MSLIVSNEAVGADAVLLGSAVTRPTLFRTLCLATAMIVTGCATPHNTMPPPSSTAAAAPGVSPSGAAAPSADVESRRVAAAAKKLNLDVVKKDGQLVYCRSIVVTGSAFQKDRQCFTAQQVEAMQEQTQQSAAQ
jgi:hypothetical protein